MRRFIRKLLHTATPPAGGVQPAPRPALPRCSPLAQTECTLFSKLSTEVRLLVYKAVLADPDRLLHFLHTTPTRGRPNKLGHWRCDDTECPKLTWQHKCFGVWVAGGALVTRDASHTNGDLIFLLMTCRQM
jgi:hypothetical protein